MTVSTSIGKSVPAGLASAAGVSSSRRAWLAAAALLLLGAIFYAVFVVRDYSGPLVGGADYDDSYRGDANYFEFLGYYVRDHWHFGLSPIAFGTKDVGYPEGTHIGLLSWCAERDLFAAMLLRAFGPGPWVQIYVTLGAWLGAVGVTAILRPWFGIWRGALVGFAASFMSFYAWYKFPYHLNMAVIHWVTMSIALDAVTMRLVVQGKRLTVPFLLLRAALIVLSIGLDLGYVAGHALTSCTVTVYCAWVELGRRDRRLFRRFALALPEHPLVELRERVVGSALAASLLLFGLCFYVPFVLAVVRDTATYPMTDAGGNFWASQLHAFFPYLPGIHPNSALVRSLFGHDEGVGEYAPGFALMLAAGTSLWLAHRRDRFAVVKPLLVTTLLIFVFHPRWCKSLQIFPWFAYYRVAGRGTTVMPVLLALIAIAIDGWPRLVQRLVLGLGLAEFLTASVLANEYRPTRLEPRHRAYFEAIRSTKGEALLEWPFCIAGARSPVTRELCPYFATLSTAYAYRRFHEKSTVSFYLSRIHERQFQGWLDGGWASMFSPDDRTRQNPTREARCFDEAQWKVFDAFYRGHDFVGIQLYTDLLPVDCVAGFHARYGEPRAAESLPRVGRVEFIERLR